MDVQDAVHGADVENRKVQGQSVKSTINIKSLGASIIVIELGRLNGGWNMLVLLLSFFYGRPQSLAGLLVTLSEVGHLDVVYLGTQPVEYGFSMSQRHMKDRACVRAIAALKQQLAMEPGVQPRADASCKKTNKQIARRLDRP